MIDPSGRMPSNNCANEPGAQIDNTNQPSGRLPMREAVSRLPEPLISDNEVLPISSAFVNQRSGSNQGGAPHRPANSPHFGPVDPDGVLPSIQSDFVNQRSGSNQGGAPHRPANSPHFGPIDPDGVLLSISSAFVNRGSSSNQRLAPQRPANYADVDQWDDVPDRFIDPIVANVMENPVRVSVNEPLREDMVFDQSTVDSFRPNEAGQRLCPYTRLPIISVVSDDNLRQDIQSYIAQRRSGA